MSDATLIVPRRNFLIRALGFTAAGASVAVPIITMDSAQKRFDHHLKGLSDAARDLFPTRHVTVRGNCLNGGDVRANQASFAGGGRHTAVTVLMVTEKFIDWDAPRSGQLRMGGADV